MQPSAETRRSGGDPPVTVLVARRAKRGREAAFEAHLEGVTAAAGFPGHLGATIFPPRGPDDREYSILFRFDHQSNLRRWEESDERKAWLAKARELAEDEPRIRILTGLETWFTLPVGEAVIPPPPWKMALVSLVAIWPLTMLANSFIGPQLTALPIPLRTLILVAITIPIPMMTWVVMPRLTRLLRRWLYPAAPAQTAAAIEASAR